MFVRILKTYATSSCLRVVRHNLDILLWNSNLSRQLHGTRMNPSPSITQISFSSPPFLYSFPNPMYPAEFFPIPIPPLLYRCQSTWNEYAWLIIPEYQSYSRILLSRQWDLKQEAQLMLTNLRDAFRGKSRSPNIVPFHVLGIPSIWNGTIYIVSYCATVTLSLSRAIFFLYSTSKNVMTLKSGSEFTQGHWKWYYSIDWVWFPISVT